MPFSEDDAPSFTTRICITHASIDEQPFRHAFVVRD